MGLGFIHGLKKQASLFFKTMRLALTDVTPVELLTKASTNRKSRIPDTQTMASISRAAFEIEEFWRIVEILRKRLSRFNRKHWRRSYKALILLEYLLIHGPKSIAAEFQNNRDDIKKLGGFQYNDKRGFDWGLAVRNKTERILQLLENEYLLQEERDRARRLTYGIEGFSFGQQSLALPEKEIQHGSCSHFDEHSLQENSFSNIQESLIDDSGHQTKISVTWENFDDAQMSTKTRSFGSYRKNSLPRQSSSKMVRNIVLTNQFVRETHEWDDEQRERLLGCPES